MVKKLNVEDRILKKSIDLFYKYGYSRASIRDIVRAVGINNSTVYLYFKNKDDILYNIILSVGGELLEDLQTVTEQYNNAYECLRAMIFKQICFSLEGFKRMKIYLEEQYQLPPHLRKKTYKQHRQIYDLYYEKICELEEENFLKKTDKTVMTFGLFAMMNWVYRWFQSKGRLSIEEVANNIIDMFFEGVLENRSAKG